MFLLRAAVYMLVRKVSLRGPVCIRCLILKYHMFGRNMFGLSHESYQALVNCCFYYIVLPLGLEW